jgi:DnaJ-class molecular chaperone
MEVVKMKKYECDKCGGSGKREAYLHIDNGVCYKCEGKGVLNYNPTPKGSVTAEYTDHERFEIEQEQQMIERAEYDNWAIANNFMEAY